MLSPPITYLVRTTVFPAFWHTDPEPGAHVTQENNPFPPRDRAHPRLLSSVHYITREVHEKDTSAEQKRVVRRKGLQGKLQLQANCCLERLKHNGGSSKQPSLPVHRVNSRGTKLATTPYLVLFTTLKALPTAKTDTLA